ncbi:hypothetical protein BDV37DRAFT_103830 [Aspergillus pseudonomiae]|uniref:Uncharacterized protein n=1 Tax=Aspergillus pseudonomiae TaxID=1506151 RepID=A0A5N7DF82_9EURO|nr:uncharacterized protein BDV37DRAFT_103830 [Aspergillus pseudonomiae]KAE8404939.1 hypothetical protein BDV37DRAFT_103830 [Aspergillus pseudonomiae]
MAAAHPEGEVYFQRSSLRFSNNLGFFDAENANHFYSHFLIEWVTNEAMAREVRGLPEPNHRGPRSQYLRERPSGVPRTWFGFWSHLPVSYGSNNNIRRWAQIPLERNPAEFRDRDRGGAQKVRVHPCPLPTEQEQWIWIDLVTPIRAIYFPLSQQADQDFPQLCTYVQINFYHQSARDIWRPRINRFLSHEFTPEFGVGFAWGHSLGINVQECIKLLALTPRLRVTNIWREKLIVIREIGDIATGHLTPQVRPNLSFDFINFINANFAVDVIWKPVPPRNSFLLNLIENVVSAGLGLVPGVGPLLSAGFSVAWLAITDPEGFTEWAKNGGWALTWIEMVIGSADSMNGYIDPNWRGSPRQLMATEETTDDQEGQEIQEVDWDHIGPSDLLLDGLRIMAHSAKGTKPPLDDHLHTEILRRAVECRNMSHSEALAIEQGLRAEPEPTEPEELEDSESDSDNIQRTERGIVAD